MDASVAIFVPSLNRPEKLLSLIENIHETTSESHKIYFAVSDQASLDILNETNETFIHDDGSSWVDRINKLYDTTNEPYMFLGSDDLVFHQNWFPYAMDTMRAIDGVVPVNDLHNPNGTSALVSRNYIDAMSGCIDTPRVIVYPGYKHNYADTELFATAASRNKLKYCEQSVVEHLHWQAGKAEFDPTYAKSRDNWGIDEVLFASRQPLWQK